MVALYSPSGANTYSGPIFLQSSTSNTIGVNTGSTLTITNVIDDGGNLPGFPVTKELTGLLVFAHSNTFSGLMTVAQGQSANPGLAGSGGGDGDGDHQGGQRCAAPVSRLPTSRS